MYDYDTKSYGYDQNQEKNAKTIQSMNPGGSKKSDIRNFEILRATKEQSLNAYKERLANGEKLVESELKCMHRLETIIAGLTNTIETEKERLEIIKRAGRVRIK